MVLVWIYLVCYTLYLFKHIVKIRFEKGEKEDHIHPTKFSCKNVDITYV